MKKMLCIVLFIMAALAVMGCGTGQSISEIEAELEKESVQESNNFSESQ